MNKTVLVLGMLVVFAFTPFNVETAKADVDISGQCVGITPERCVSPDDICKVAGYYGCVSTSGNFFIYNDTLCTVMGGGGGIINCSSLICNNLFPNSGRIISTLICEDIRPWGIVPRPGNVPSDFNQTILNLTNWILGFITMIAVLALIWGGVNYLTSAGDEDRARSGKKIIQYALMGLVIAGLAYALVTVIITTILR